jgi:hypothetical protein
MQPATAEQKVAQRVASAQEYAGPERMPVLPPKEAGLEHHLVIAPRREVNSLIPRWQDVRISAMSAAIGHMVLHLLGRKSHVHLEWTD